MSTKSMAFVFAMVCCLSPLTVSHAQTTQTCVQAPSGLVSWWPGEGNTTDIADGNNGSLQGTATFAPGMVGQAFNFDGQDGAVVVGNPPNLMLQTFSIEAWIQRASPTQASVGPGGGCFFCYGPGNFGLLLEDDGRLFIGRIGIDSVFSSNLRVNDTEFHHIAMVKAGVTIKFYVDGIEEQAPDYLPILAFTNNTAIGGRGDISFPTFLQFNVFWGAIDELAIYNRALTAAEVQAIFEAGNAGKCQQGLNGVGGTVTGLRPARVVCRNVTTGQEVVIRGPSPSWNCELAGLEVVTGDIVRITILGGVN